MSRRAAISYLQPAKRIRPSAFNINYLEQNKSYGVSTAPPLLSHRRLSLRLESDEESSSAHSQFSLPNSPTNFALLGSEDSQAASEYDSRHPKHTCSFQKHKQSNTSKKPAHTSPLALRHPLTYLKLNGSAVQLPFCPSSIRRPPYLLIPSQTQQLPLHPNTTRE